MVILHALGECVIRTSIATITPRADLGFALASRLIAQRGKRVSRQSLLALFWPASPAHRAAHALSEALHKLRRKGVPVLGDDTSCVWVEREAVSTDIERLSADAPHTLLDRDFTILPGYFPNATPVFHDWLDDWRDELHHRLVAELLKATARADGEGDARTAMSLAEQLLKLDPTNQAALAAAADAVESLRAAARVGSPQRAPVVAVAERRARSRWIVPVDGLPPARDTLLVGRKPDLVIGRALLDSARRSRGGALYISGAAGIGKSRLVRAMVEIAQAHGMAVASVSCQQSDPFRPLSAFVDVVPMIRLLPGAAGAAPPMTEYLDRLTNHSASDYAPNVDAREVEHIFGCIQHAVFDLVEAVSDEQPLVIVVENMQWLDAASSKLLQEMSGWASTRAVAFILTSRVPWRCSGLDGCPTLLKLHSLQPLSDDAAGEHALHYAHAIGQLPPDDLLQWCVAASEGNPYLLEELLNHWVATNEQFATSPSLATLLEARLDRLSGIAIGVLQICAVLGRNSTLARLERVLEYAPHELFGALEDLATAGMLRAERDEDGSGGNRILCRHDILAQSALSRLSPAGLELLHRRAGLVLEAELGSPDSASLLWACATHWYAAGNSIRAVELGRACVGHLLEIGLAQEATDGCRRTLTFCTRPADRLDVLTTLATTLQLTRSWTDLFVVVEQIRSEQSAIGLPHTPHDDLELLVLEAQWHTHRSWDATLASAIACSRAEAADPRLRVRAGILVLKIATNLADPAAINAVYRTLNSVAELPCISSADRLLFRMIYHAVCGSHSDAASAARTLLADVRDSTPEIRHLATRVNCATALCRAGDFSQGEREFIDVFHRAVALHAETFAGEISQHLIKTYLDIGKMEEAERWSHLYMGLHRPQSELWNQRPVRLGLARIEIWRGNMDAADHLLSNGNDPLWNDTIPEFQAASLAAKIRVEIGRKRSAHELLPLVEKLDSLSSRLRSLGSQDSETLALYLGMSYIGHRSDAAHMLVRYIQSERRDSFAPLPELAAEIERISLDTTGSERDEA